ncbi:MAG: nucleoside transporter C-terminal domain-containing protein [Elusimicrobiaceae bacterium]|nr:nucleoside transporter C-terminal domain-containing protein [Elusimicrobiaceae bacterium]
MLNFIAVVGVVAMWAGAWALCKNRRDINWKTIGWGIALQLVFALLVLKTRPGQWCFETINDLFVFILSFQKAGAEFVFGSLGASSSGFYFAFQVLPTIIFFSALMAVLYYLGIMQMVVSSIARVMTYTCKSSGAESLTVAANIFVGQTEAPLLVRPFIERMTESELFTVMVAGMATMSGGVVAAYVGMLQDVVPNVAGHILTASVMAAPAALVMSKMMAPEVAEPETRSALKIEYKDPSNNVVDAAANGTITGLQLALNVGAMLIAFLGLIALFNGILGGATAWLGSHIFGMQTAGFNLQDIIGWCFSPVAWLMGVEWKDCVTLGQLMGEKFIANEFVAYSHLSNILKATPDLLSPRSTIVAVYALCGFANVSSIGILIGGLSGMAPGRKQDVARLGIRCLIAASLCGFLNGAIAGILN